LILLALSSCARRAPSGPPLPLPLEEAAWRLEPVRQQELTVARYQAVARARGSGPQGRFSATLLLAFERPDRLRVELLGPLGSSRWMAIVAGGEITVLFPSRREFLQERAVPEVLAALVGVRWGPDEIMAVLSGAGLPLHESTLIAAFQEGSTVRVGLADELSLRLSGEQVIEANARGYRVRYPSAWRSKGRAAPDRIELESQDVSVALAMLDLDVNVRLRSEVFELSIPQGTTRVELAEVGGEAFFVKSQR